MVSFLKEVVSVLFVAHADFASILREIVSAIVFLTLFCERRESLLMNREVFLYMSVHHFMAFIEEIYDVMFDIGGNHR